MPRPTLTQADLVALCCAPILMGAAMLLDLTPLADDTTELLTLVAASPGRWMWANLVFLCAGVAWTVAALGLLRRLGSRSRTVALGAVGVAAGGVTLGLIEATMAYLPALAQSGASMSDRVGVVETLDASPLVLTFELVHIVGWLGGQLLIVVGLLLTRAVPRWVPVTLLVGLVGLVAFATGPGLALASCVLAAGSTGLAVHLARARQLPAPAPHTLSVP
ncbi:hypothetical protein FNH13_15525 [Ornithinimicrobium ciconiae]|uniref:DUF4386 family protein n=1 Tax=Ornithinimicrobium ciconiae TaxID=2594265 RepID=A0A516GDG8_9MICO|nr:hypothetical protein [Ornithinimicrobium ciconiae]QDO89566.1 hypothetical protein FNH13_15525 [Ornithinimicrobium ciconiae]